MKLSRILVISTAILLSGLQVAAQEAPNPTEKRFIEFTEEMYKAGQKWTDSGCSRQANWFYGQAAAAVASWRTAIAQIGMDLRIKAEKEETDKSLSELNNIEGGAEFISLLGKLQGMSESVTRIAENVEKKGEQLGIVSFKVEDHQWNYYRSLCLASPYPDFFRGVVCDWKGDKDGTVKYYSRAKANPFFPGFEFDFSYLAHLEFIDLVALSERLKRYQARYEGAMIPDSFYFEYDVPTWDADALARTAADYLSKESDYTKAQEYLEAAMHVNPFDVKYVYLCAMLYTQIGDGAASARCLNEAMKMDPGNTALQGAISKWNSSIQK